MSEAKAVDLSSLRVSANESAVFELELLHPGDQAPLGAYVGIIGQDSPEYRARQRDFERDHLRNYQKKRNFTITPEESEAQAIELLATATKSFRGLVLDGREVDASMARAIYADPGYSWIREQVSAAMQDRANFLPKSAKP